MVSCWWDHLLLAEESGKQHGLPSSPSSASMLLLPLLLSHCNSVPIVHLDDGSINHHKCLETWYGKTFQAWCCQLELQYDLCSCNKTFFILALHFCTICCKLQNEPLFMKCIMKITFDTHFKNTSCFASFPFLQKFLCCIPPGNARLHFCFFLGAGLLGRFFVVGWVLVCFSF